MEWLVPVVFAVTFAMAHNAEECIDYKFERCEQEYPDSTHLCADPRQFIERTRGWECQ